MKPYYEDNAVKIYHGDSCEVMPLLEPGIAHLCATDPPYFRVVEAEWDDQWGPDVAEFLGWLGGVIDLAVPLLADRGSMAVFCSPDLSAGVELEVRKRMAVLNHIVWRKPGPGRLGAMDKSTLRRFFPTSERVILAEKARNPDGDLFRFRDTVNHAVARETWAELRLRLAAMRDASGLTNREIDEALGTKGMASHYFGASQWSLPTREAWEVIRVLFAAKDVESPDFDEIRAQYDSKRREFDSRRREFDSRRREFDSKRREFDTPTSAETRALELLSDVWTFDTVPIADRLGGHPTQKPIALMQHLIGTMSRVDDVVFDPFMGTGTTLRAAKDIGRKAIGIEREEHYCEIAAQRMSQEVFKFEEAA